MSAHGQFCSVARANDALGGRWTLLIVREVMCGARRFSEIRRGVPRISKTMLAERLQALVHLGVLARVDPGPEYVLTASGADLLPVIQALGVWGQTWLPRQASTEDLDLEPLLIDMQRRVRGAALPPEALVIRFEIAGHRPHFLLLKASEVSFCTQNPGFPEPLAVRAPLDVLVGWWRGDFGLADAQRRGLRLDGPRELARAFEGWFDRYLFADVPAAAE